MSVTNADLARRAQAVWTPNYRPAPIVLDRGEGMYVFDVEGRRFLDMISGIAVSALGHNNPELIEAITAQAGKILHTSNLYFNAPAIQLAEKIASTEAFPDRVYFCNSGAEANEGAIKLARKFAYDNGQPERTEIVSFDGSFHGRTFAALAATARPKYHVGFQPLPAGFRYVPYEDLSALEAAVGANTAAVIVEPIQGEGGVNVPSSGFLRGVREICDAAGALLIFDEVQCGVGRCGTVFAHQHDGVTPDVMSLAKGIGGGLPLGATVASERVAASLTYGSHATTYGGNPVACAAGSVVFDAITRPGFLDNVNAMGELLQQGLRDLSARTGVFEEVRGRGLLIGAQVAKDAGITAMDIVHRCRDQGVLVHVAGPDVVRLAPPLVITPDQVTEALEAIASALAPA